MKYRRLLRFGLSMPMVLMATVIAQSSTQDSASNGDSDSGGGTDSDSGTATANATENAGPTSSGADGSSGLDPSAATDANDSSSEGGDDSSGTTGAEGEMCGQCVYAEACGLLEGSFDDCLNGCELTVDNIEDEACRQATIDLNRCHGTATCDGIFETCDAEFQAEFAACENTEPHCTALTYIAKDVSECSVQQSCANISGEDDFSQGVQCGDDGDCTCFYDDVMVGSCQVGSFCVDLEAIPGDDPTGLADALMEEFLEGCCGFEPLPL